MHHRFKLAIVTLSTILLATLMIGTLLGGSEDTQDAYRHFAVYTEVISRIKSDYVEEPDMKSVTLGALNGLLESVDPYASYLSAEQYKQYLANKGAKNAATGLLLSRRFGYVGVVDSIPNSPADKAGLSTGDVLETIAGVATRDMPLAYAELLLEGAPGTTIELTVMRVRRGTKGHQGRPDPRTAQSARPHRGNEGRWRGADQGAQPRSGQVPPGRLQARRAHQTRRPEARPRSPPQCLRRRRRGHRLANLFLDKGLITYLQGQKHPKQEFNAEATKAVWKQPLVVLTNRGTAGGARSPPTPWPKISALKWSANAPTATPPCAKPSPWTTAAPSSSP